MKKLLLLSLNLLYAVNNGGDGYYNLAGQRVSADYKGIVIHNGKKVVKK